MDTNDIGKWLGESGTLIINGDMCEKVEPEEAASQLEALHTELDGIKQQVIKAFDKGEEMVSLIEIQAKMRLLIEKRLKNVKKIPQECVDKYNAAVTEIRDIIKEQAKKET